MSTIHCYPVKLMIADLIRVKSICSNTQFRRILNQFGYKLNFYKISRLMRTVRTANHYTVISLPYIQGTICDMN
jgi:hypothetical protein